jgi:hypothetical protein
MNVQSSQATHGDGRSRRKCVVVVAAKNANRSERSKTKDGLKRKLPDSDLFAGNETVGNKPVEDFLDGLLDW